MELQSESRLRWLFSPSAGLRSRLLPRWLFLRSLGLIYCSAFYSLLYQIKGLIGPHGILPAGEYLAAVSHTFAGHRLWYAPTLLWLSPSSPALLALCWTGLIASLLLVVNVWPRAMLVCCFLCFLSFVTAASDFSSYQSDGMLLEAGFLSLFLAPRGFLPGFGAATPPSRASYFLLQWEWFRIYFESGMVKLLSGDPEWRNLTAMVDYYQNGPLPTWIGWYAAHLPHWFHWWTALLTLVLELALVWLAVLPRRTRLLCFALVTPWQLAVIVTANYTFLNYLVLVLGFLLLDDAALRRWWPRRFRMATKASVASDADDATPRWRKHVAAAKLATAAVLLTLVGYVTTAEMIFMVWRSAPLPSTPVAWVEPFRIANQYGLFAVMTRGRYEIEFQGSDDGKAWTAYPFRYKPQALNEAPRVYAPYQPRFDWNLWFASLSTWTQSSIVPRTEELLLANDPDVLGLFAGNPFAQHPPRLVRAVLWQYWFTTASERRASGNWWRRELLGTYAPTIEREANGRFGITEPASLMGPPE